MPGNHDYAHDLLKRIAPFADYADVYYEDSRSLLVLYEDGCLRRLDAAADSGVGIRLYRDGVTFYGYATTTDDSALRELADGLIRFSCENSASRVLTPQSVSVRGYTIDPSGEDIRRKIALVEEIDRLSWSDKRVAQVRAYYRESERKTRLVNTLGADVSQNLSWLVGSSDVVVTNGDDMQTGSERLGGMYGFEQVKDIDPSFLAGNAVRRALLNLEADYAPAGRMPVILASQAGGTMVHEAVGHGLEADLVYNGLSVYEGLLGEQVASPLVTVIDDATLAGKRGTFLYDDEGAPAERTVCIENGILKNYLFDQEYALKENQSSTGNGRRESFRHRPIVRMSNTFIAPGKTDPDAIVRSVPNGLYVVQMGGGEVNTVNGDFVFEVTEGYLIENGVVGRPVKNATLIGNGPEIMREIDMVGSDFGFAIGTCGKDGQGVPVSDAQPTLRIPEMTVGGK